MTKLKTLPGIHDHEDEKEEIETQKFRQKLKKASKGAHPIAETKVNFAIEQASTMVPSFSSMIGSLYRARRKKLSPIPKSF